MSSSDSLSSKYAVARMAEVMSSCNEMLYMVQKEVYDASREIEAMKKFPAVCRTSSTCFGRGEKIAFQRTPMSRSTSLPTPPDAKCVRDPVLRQLYEKLIEVEGVGRHQWLNAFMYVSSYMRVPRLLARSEFDQPKKFVQRQTLLFDGPYPGIKNDLIVTEKGASDSRINGKLPGHVIDASRPSISVRNVELEKTSLSPKSTPRFACDCLGLGNSSPSFSSEIRKRRLLVNKKLERGFQKRLDYCLV
ncbi:uncharacterized protein LOC124295400 [Neodiprion lecontei]|uniref:Uncharacterized protein LOC124295400 n=1 Tax=Neodiprion lecontei TaxID=441921 RepID=A0ABM3GLW0_NEOLC|nr:uncharacterized protein LOC124295400 [Neodiprion lecontei]